VKTEVQFKSTAFNCTEPRDYFINECCFGDDVCRWLMQKLRERGVQASDEPGQEDFGWFFNFNIAGVDHCFVLGFQPNDPASGDQWLGSIERSAGFVASIFGRRNKGILPEAVEALNAILTSSPDIRDVTWHEPGKSG
jgi:hypothetical protein